MLEQNFLFEMVKKVLRGNNSGRFRKRMVLANVPLFRFSVVPVLVQGNFRMYPRSCFWYRGHPPKGAPDTENPSCTGFTVPGKSRTKKRGFSKGGFCRVQCHGQETKSTQGYWAQQYIWHSERHSQERRIFLQKPPSKKPLFLVPEKGLRPWSRKGRQTMDGVGVDPSLLKMVDHQEPKKKEMEQPESDLRGAFPCYPLTEKYGCNLDWWAQKWPKS